MRTFPACLALGAWLLAAPALADVPGPNDHLCTLEAQQADGSRCEACSMSFQQAQEEANPCASLAQRAGWSLRCQRGATVQSRIYCDREADYRRVAGSEAPSDEASEGAPPSGCGCRVAERSASIPPALGLALLAFLWWRRAR